jgi:Protein of unknown function (DUF2924)
VTGNCLDLVRRHKSLGQTCRNRLAKPMGAANRVRPGTILGREWNGQMQRVAVRADGFAWNGKTYPSLSQVAFAITGTRWNGPRFFGLRDKPEKVGAA